MNPLIALVAFAGIFGAVFLLMLSGAKVFAKKPEVALETGTIAPEQPRLLQPETKRNDKMARLQTRLEQAGMSFDAETYTRRVRMFSVAGALLGLIMGGFGVGGCLFGAVLAFGGLRGGDFYVTYRFNRRLQEFVDQFCDALGVMSSGVKSGQTVSQTFETIEADFSDPIQGEIAEVIQELRMGVPFDEALNHWVERLPCEDLEIACTALAVQRQTGGNVAEILDTVANTIRERNKLHKQIRTLTAQGRASGWVVTLLPVGLFFALYLIAPARTGLLLTNPIGIGLTALAFMMVALGGYTIKRIITIEV